MNGPSTEILLVEDDPQDVELTLWALRREQVNTQIQVVRDGEEALIIFFAVEITHCVRRSTSQRWCFWI